MTESGYPSGLVASSVEAAIRYYYDPDADDLYRHSDVRAQLLACGLLELVQPEKFKLSSRGEVFVRHLLETPLPVSAWAVRRHPTVDAHHE